MVYNYYRTKEESRAEGKASGSDTLRTNAPKQKGKTYEFKEDYYNVISKYLECQFI